MRETQVNDHNRLDYYRSVYPMLNEGADNLIDISYENNPVVAIDCCGWHYSQVFSKEIIMLETLYTAKSYRLNQQQFTKLIDNRNETLTWPNLPNIVDPVVLLDRSPLLKYLSMDKFKSVMLDIVSVYNPSKLLVRGQLQFIDDNRLSDRIQSWQYFFPFPGFVVTKFLYDTRQMTYFFDLKKCQ